MKPHQKLKARQLFLVASPRADEEDIVVDMPADVPPEAPEFYSPHIVLLYISVYVILFLS